MIFDESSVVWNDNQIDTVIVDGYGVVTYGARDESSGDSKDKALAKLYAAAQLLRGLSRDKSKYFSWKSAQGESADKTKTPDQLRQIAEDYMKNVNEALKRDIDRARSDVQLATEPQGAILEFGKNVVKFSDRNFDRRLNKHNRPSDR